MSQWVSPLGNLKPCKSCIQMPPCLGLPCVTWPSCLAFLNFSDFICKIETLPSLKNHSGLKWDNILKCAVYFQSYSGHSVNIMSSLLATSKLRSELHVNAQILLSGQRSVCIVEDFVILAHFCILSWVFEEKMLLSTTLWVLFKGFTKCFLIHLKLLFKASRITHGYTDINNFQRLLNGIYTEKNKETVFQKLSCCIAFSPL